MLPVILGSTIMTLPMHIFCETFSIVISMIVFAIAYASTEDRPVPVILLGAAFLAVGLCDFAHMLSFNGMPDFVTPANREKGLNFWLAARLIFALALLSFPLLPWRPCSSPRTRYWLLAGSLTLTALVYWLGLYHQEIWPRTFIEGQGLTRFKVGAEYTIISILFCAGALFYYNAHKSSPPYDAENLFVAAVITILSEFTFTVYSEVTDVFNLVGHLYKILAYLFIYKAIFVVSVQTPFQRLHKAIDEMEQSDTSLGENRATLKQILDTAPQSIFWKDLDGVYMGCNQVFAQAVGLDDPEQIQGKTDFDLPWPKEEAEAYRADDLEVMQGHQSKRHIVEPLQQADGRRLWIDTTKVPLLNKAGKVIGVLGVFEDITERKQAEDEREELETRVRQSQKMEAIGTLAGGIAHDFNNILSVIFGYTELAIEEKDPEERSQHLEQVRLGAERARELVKQILTVSRRTELEQQPLQIALVIKEALKMLRSSIPTTIEIKQEINSSEKVLADSTQIHQVIMNLCTNAYYAMRETGGILAVSLNEIEIRSEDECYGELAPGRYLKLAVSDTGCGISPKIREKIFEPYFTTKKRGEGTGLGLAVVHGIIKSCHGHITVYSELGKGTTFHVYLPVIDENAAEPPAKEIIEDLTGKGERLMLVDDEPQIREVVETLFSRHGYQVTTFPNAVQAFEEFQKHPGQFDLIITDMTMPYMTGAELAQEILGIRPDIPIILCTGQSELINKEKALAMGICDYLNKPVLQHDFLSAVHKALAKGKSSPSAG